MIEIIATIGDMTQKFKTDKEGKRHVNITLKAEVKDGHKRVADIAKHLNKPVHLRIEELQPGLLDKEEGKE